MADNGTPHDEGVADRQARVEIRRLAEQEERERQAYTSFTADEVRDSVGEGTFHQGKRVLERHLESLPEDQRQRLEDEMRHSPARVMEVVGELLGPIPTDKIAIDAELEASRKRMRDDPKGWYADDKAQMRYQGLTRAAGERAQEPKPWAPREIRGTGRFFRKKRP